MPSIRKLQNHIINQIAAGEVLERPSAALKELIENSIDAGAKNISIHIRNGGKSILSITDDGTGISKEELPLAVERHATSKLENDDLVHLKHFGFRGEALASMAAVSNLIIKSRTKDDICYKMETSPSGEPPKISPTSGNQGTTVEIRNLFQTTPARLKFLQSDKSETMAITETTKKMALANPNISFTLQDSTTDKMRVLFSTKTKTQNPEENFERICEIMGKGFKEHSFKIDVQREGIHIKGWVSTPHLVRGSTKMQFAFVNQRSVKDKTISGALRGAVQDMLPFGKHLMSALFVEIEPSLVDVNVHPAKEEVRFQNPAHIRGLIVSSIRNGLTQVKPETTYEHPESHQPTPEQNQLNLGTEQNNINFVTENPTQSKLDAWKTNQNFEIRKQEANRQNTTHGLVDNRFILFQSENEMFCLDLQTYLFEKYEKQIHLEHEKNAIKTEPLLIPEIFDPPIGCEKSITEHQNLLTTFGFNFENFGGTSWLLRERPQHIQDETLKDTLLDIVKTLSKPDLNSEQKRLAIKKILVQESAQTKIKEISSSTDTSLIEEVHQDPNAQKHMFKFTANNLLQIKDKHSNQ